jgi:hypothetical protein
VTPIPVLVGGAKMPRREQLPSQLQPLARRNALELSDGRWGYDVGRLMSTLDRLLADISQGAPEDRSTAEPSPPSWRLLAEGVLVAGVTAYLARRLGQQIDPDGNDTGKIARVVLRSGETWALTGAAISTWLALRTRRDAFVGFAVIGLLIGALAGTLGGATWALPHFLADVEGDAAEALGIGAVAVTGATFGSLIGSLWRPARGAAGLATGLLAGALCQLVVVASGWDAAETGEAKKIALLFAVQAIAISGATLATMLALDLRQAESGRGGSTTVAANRR